MPHPPSATASDVLPTRRHTTRHPQPRNQLQPLLDYTLFASASLRSEHVSSPTISELAAHRSRLARNSRAPRVLASAPSCSSQRSSCRLPMPQVTHTPACSRYQASFSHISLSVTTRTTIIPNPAYYTTGESQSALPVRRNRYLPPYNRNHSHEWWRTRQLLPSLAMGGEKSRPMVSISGYKGHMAKSGG
jgi:hypothetical protein